jgi:sugar diacid utilization regulator
VIAFTDTTAPAEIAELHTAAARVLSQAQCRATLLLPVGAQQVWAWGSRTSRPPELPAALSPAPEAGAKVAVGMPGGGIKGFRRSHEQAMHAARIGTNINGDRWLFDYHDVDVVAMLSTDMDAAREFAVRELGALAGRGEPATNLRRTLKCYLDRDRSLAGAAQELHIARNTVAYRVQRAEELRGRPINERRMQLHAALTLVDELGHALLPPSDG